MFCSRCGSEITGTSKFCPSCGLDLADATPVHAMATGTVQEIDVVREALSAEYEILEELGRGGMAFVYRARDRQLEREVAIKVLPFSLAFDAEFVERFQREARTAAQLEHPNIIPIYRVGRVGRVIYFVMKFLRGGSLSTVLAERTKLTPPDVRRILVEAGSALGYAAQRGIVHRDIKPDNIMFDEFGQCVLTDFGIAKAATGQRLTGTGMSIGTPHYMSPEQARAQAIDGRSDLYGLGVVAYQCLTGAVPYDGEDSFSIGYKHITEPVPTPALVTADEHRLFEVIKRMLMKEPDERFQTCEELLAALRGHPISAVGAVRVTGHYAVQARTEAGAVPVGTGAGGITTPPSIASQPTTPLTSPLVDRRNTPRSRRDAPTRRLADRSVAMRNSSAHWGWAWLALVALGGAGGGAYYYVSRGAVAAPNSEDISPVGAESLAVRADSVPVGGVPLASAGGSRAAAAFAESLARAGAAESTARNTSTRDSAAAAVAGVDSAGSRAGKPQEGATPRPVRADSGAPQAAAKPLTLPRCLPGPQYDPRPVCFDDRPKPVNQPFVRVPADTLTSPTPSILWVKVSAEGRTAEVRQLRRSNDDAFEREVRSFVYMMTWHPALKNGAPVEAWTQLPFPPLRP